MPTKTKGTDCLKVLRVVDFDSGSNSFPGEGRVEYRNKNNGRCGSRRIPAGLNKYSTRGPLRNRITLGLRKGGTASCFDRLSMTPIKKSALEKLSRTPLIMNGKNSVDINLTTARPTAGSGWLAPPSPWPLPPESGSASAERFPPRCPHPESGTRRPAGFRSPWPGC